MLLDPSTSASLARPLHWQDDAGRQRYADTVLGVLRSWSADWGVAEPSVGCDSVSSGRASDRFWWPLSRPAGGSSSAWLSMAAADGATELASLLFGRAGHGGTSEAFADANSLAMQTGRDAWAALRSALAGGFGLEASSELEVAPVSAVALPLSHAWSGDVRLTLGWQRPDGTTWALNARIRLPPPLPSRVTKIQKSQGAGLRTLTSALRRYPVRAQARLADISTTLGDLLSLQQGDVLLTSHRLEQPMLMFAAGPAFHPLWAARLAQRDQRVAAVLVSAQQAAQRMTPNRIEGTKMTTPSSTAASSAASAQWVNLPEAADPSATAQPLAAASNPLLGVKATLQVCVGEATLTVGDLTQASVGQVIKLDREVDGLVDLLLDGQVVARGELVAVEDCFGVRLAELPLPLSAPAA